MDEPNTSDTRPNSPIRDELFRLLIESVKDYAIFLLDSRGRIASWNPGAARIKGYAAEEIIGKHFSVFYPPEDRSLCDTELVVSEREGRFEGEGWRLRKDGSKFWANAVITAVRDAEGRLVGFGKVTRDLTDRLEREQERLRLVRAESEQQELRRTEQFRERFLAIVSHDLRSPLNAIMMSATILLRSADLPPQLAKPAGRILANVHTMTAMVGDLLDFTRGRLGGGIPIDPKPIDLRHAVAHALEEIEQVHPLRRFEFEVRGDTRGEWDAGRIGQIVANLVGNAVQHGAREQPVRVRLDAHGDEVRLTVHNDGPLIPADLLPHIFDPFRRGGSVDPHSGIGLGLYIASELTRVHGGRIGVTSDETGTTFTVALPRLGLARASLPSRPEP